MIYITLLSVIGIVVLQSSGAIPAGSVGGSITIGFAFIAAALTVGIHEAWTNKRGVLGWIVNLVVSFLGVFVVVPIVGPVFVILLGDGSRSLMSTGGPRAAVTLACVMLISLLGAWGALRIVNRWR
jgi:hypothetical protein